MSEKYTNWLTKLKKKYRSEIDELKEEEYRYLVTNYRFDGSTLLFIFEIQFQLYNLTILIIVIHPMGVLCLDPVRHPIMHPLVESRGFFYAVFC